MRMPRETLIELEHKFWEAIVKEDTAAALDLLTEPALMVSAHGALKFDHAGYRKMAEQGSMTLTSFELSDMDVVFPNDKTAVLSYRVRQRVAPRGKDESTVQEMNDTSTWVQVGHKWQCVVHTETPVANAKRPNA